MSHATMVHECSRAAFNGAHLSTHFDPIDILQPAAQKHQGLDKLLSR